MRSSLDRFSAAPLPAIEAGWRLEELTPPSALFVANGLRLGCGGELYVAQAFGSRISALDIETSQARTVYDGEGPAFAPDDLAFDSIGNMFVTDVMGGQVCVAGSNGIMEVLRGDLPSANGITVYQDRLFIDECRHHGRLIELSRGGELLDVLAEDLPGPNALAVGPDGHHYFPVIDQNQIWRVPLNGGQPEIFASDLGVPLAVKFTSKGDLITVQGMTGDVLKFDVRTGARTRLAALRPGLDNLEITPDDRIFVSHFIDAGIAEITADGREIPLSPPGIVGPYGLDLADDGTLWASDGIAIIAMLPGEQCRRVGQIVDGEFPGWVNSLAVMGDGRLVVVTSAGSAVAYDPQTHEMMVLADGLDQPTDVAVGDDGSIYVVEAGSGSLARIANGELQRVATDLGRPGGVATDGKTCFVSDADGGRVYRVDGGSTILVEGLVQPEGLTVSGGTLWVLDAGTGRLHAHNLANGETRIVASNLPIGSPRGGKPRILPGMGAILPGPLRPFAGIAGAPDGTLIIGANGSGAFLALRPM